MHFVREEAGRYPPIMEYLLLLPTLFSPLILSVFHLISSDFLYSSVIDAGNSTVSSADNSDSSDADKSNLNKCCRYSDKSIIVSITSMEDNVTSIQKK